MMIFLFDIKEETSFSYFGLFAVAVLVIALLLTYNRRD